MAAPQSPIGSRRRLGAELRRLRLKTGLTRSTSKLGDSLAGLATGTLPLDEERLDEIEEALIAADLGPAVAGRIRARLADAKFAKGDCIEFME